MTKITNSGKRRLGLAGRPSLVLDAGQSAEVTQEQYKSFISNKTVARWFDSGVLAVSEDAGQPKMKIKKPEPVEEKVVAELPAGLTGKGVELYHVGNGWWEVYVNSFNVTDTKVRKAEADSIAKDYG